MNTIIFVYLALCCSLRASAMPEADDCEWTEPAPDPGSLYHNNKNRNLDAYYNGSQLKAPTAEPPTVNCSSINPELANCTCAYDYVNCNGKGFHSIPSDLTKLPVTVTRLLFANNAIASLSQLKLGNGSNIETIDLKLNRISKISSDAFGNGIADSIEFLSLCRNVDLNDFIALALKTRFPKLRLLKLNRAAMPLQVADSVFKNATFPLLYKLELNAAQVKFGARPFADFDKLNYLRLDANGLAELPCDNLRQLKSLIVLDLSSNSLGKQAGLGRCLNNLESLNQLTMRSNQLQETSLDGLSLVNLESLDLAFNSFAKIPYNALKEVKNLNSLRVTISQDLFVPPVIGNQQQQASNTIVTVWDKLTILDLSNSNLKYLPEYSFYKISNELSELIIQNSNIEVIDPDAFGYLTNLIHLDLSSNKLKELVQPTSLKIFDYNSLKGNINLTGNMFECSPKIRWFDTLLSYPTFEKNLKCTYPNSTEVYIANYLDASESTLDSKVLPSSRYKILPVTLFVIIVAVGITLGIFLIRRNQARNRDQQYRYRYFNERCQEDGFDTDNYPVYRDCTVSLQMKDPSDVGIVGSPPRNLNNNNSSSNNPETNQASLMNDRNPVA